MEEEKKQRGQTIRFLWVIWKHVMQYPALSLGIVFVIVSAQTITLFVPVLLQRLVDAFATTSASEFSLMAFVWRYVLPIAGLHLLSSLFWRVSGFLASTIQPRVDRDLIEYAFRAVMLQSYRFFSEKFTGSLVRRVTSLPKAFIDVAESMWWRLIPMFVSIIGGMILLSTRSLLFVGVMAAWIVAVVIGQVLINKIKRPFDTKRAIAQTIVTGAAADAITNSMNVSLFSARRFEERRFHEATQTYMELGHKAWRIGEAGMLIQNIAAFFCELALLSLSVWYWTQGLMTVGDIVFVQGILLVAFSNTHDLGRTMRRIYEAAADSHEILDIIETVPEIREKRGAKPLSVKRGAIEFDNVTFGYIQEVDVLKGYSLSVPPKQKIALIGASGSGKTTVTKLLFRFFDVQQGSITIDGQDIADVTLNSLRDAITYVPQEPILFHRSLMENIRYSRRDATDVEVIRAAKLAHCHEFIERVPEGYQALVGERGIKLSGGERQRIAIARAILKDAPILVLDEATSSLDSESEYLIQSALKRLMKNKTVIVIAHRLSTIMEMDRIIVMQEGRIIDEGTHTSLRNKVGVYQKLWNIQAGGFQI